MKGAIENYGAWNERYFTDNETDDLRAEITKEFNKDAERLIYSHKVVFISSFA